MFARVKAWLKVRLYQAWVFCEYRMMYTREQQKMRLYPYRSHRVGLPGLCSWQETLKNIEARDLGATNLPKEIGYSHANQTG